MGERLLHHCPKKFPCRILHEPHGKPLRHAAPAFSFQEILQMPKKTQKNFYKTKILFFNQKNDYRADTEVNPHKTFLTDENDTSRMAKRFSALNPKKEKKTNRSRQTTQRTVTHLFTDRAIDRKNNSITGKTILEPSRQ